VIFESQTFLNHTKKEMRNIKVKGESLFILLPTLPNIDFQKVKKLIQNRNSDPNQQLFSPDGTASRASG
jgi:hypothetical protein